MNLNENLKIQYDHSGEYFTSLPEALKEWVKSFYGDYTIENVKKCLGSAIDKLNDALDFYQNILAIISFTKDFEEQCPHGTMGGSKHCMKCNPKLMESEK